MNQPAKQNSEKDFNFSPLIAPIFISGVMIGMVSAFYLDPDRGKRRRALLRDQWNHLRNRFMKATSKKAHHWQNKFQGYQARLHLH